MNWVGGCRNRAMFKNDVRKQKEFFEKKKLQKKMKLLGVLKSPQKDNAGSMDLLTMFVVNQISSKKENSSVPMKLTHVGKFKGAQPTVRRDIQLPMSPGPPSRLCLEESQPQYSVQNFGLGRKKKSYSKYDSLKYSQLSPVLESNFSDCSNIDYQHCVPNGLSPLFSSVRYPITEKGHSPPWGVASDDTNQPQFLSFHHPRGGEDRETWTTDSHGTQQQDTLQYGNTFEQTMVQSKHHVKDEAFSAGSPVISELQWDTDLSRIQDTYVPYTDELPSGPSINLLHTRNHELSDFPSESYNAFVSDNRATFSYDESDSHSRDSSAFSIAPLLNQDRQLQSVFTEPEQVLHTHLQKTEKRGHTLPAQQCDYSFSKDNEEEDNRSFGAFEDAQTYASQDVNNCKRKIHLDGKQLLNRRIRKDLQETKGRHPDELFLSQVSGQSSRHSSLGYESPNYSPKEASLCTEDSEEDYKGVCGDGPCVDRFNKEPVSTRPGPATALPLTVTEVTIISNANKATDLHMSEKNPGRRTRKDVDRDQSVPSHVQSRLQGPNGAKRTKNVTTCHSRDVGTQTDSILKFQKSDTATQCNLGKKDPAELNRILEKRKVTNRGQTSHKNAIAEPSSATAMPGICVETGYLSLSKFTTRHQNKNDQTSPRERSRVSDKIPDSSLNMVTANPKSSHTRDSQNMRPLYGNDRRRNLSSGEDLPKGLRQDPIIENYGGVAGRNAHTLYSEHLTEDRVPVNMDGKRGTDLTPEIKVKRSSEETKTLHEIADILLMLGHKSKFQ